MRRLCLGAAERLPFRTARAVMRGFGAAAGAAICVAAAAWLQPWLPAGAPARAQTPAMQPAAPDTAAAIRAAVALNPASALDGADVSPLRATGGPQLGDAMLCLRTRMGGGPAYIAVFFEHGAVLSYRRAVAIDGCAGADYAPLPPAVAARMPPRAKPRARRTAGAVPLLPAAPVQEKSP